MEDLILGALEHEWAGQWRQFMPGMSAFLVENDTGLYVGYGGGRAIMAAGALVDVPLNPQTVAAVSELNPKLPIGGLHFGRQADIALVSLLVVNRMRESWLQPNNPASMQMVLDVIANLTSIARNVAGDLAPAVGGAPWLVDHSDGWPLIFAGHL